MQENVSEAYEAIMQEMAHLFVKLPVTSFYEVNSEVKAKAKTPETITN